MDGDEIATFSAGGNCFSCEDLSDRPQPRRLVGKSKPSYEHQGLKKGDARMRTLLILDAEQFPEVVPGQQGDAAPLEQPRMKSSCPCSPHRIAGYRGVDPFSPMRAVGRDDRGCDQNHFLSSLNQNQVGSPPRTEDMAVEAVAVRLAAGGINMGILALGAGLPRP